MSDHRPIESDDPPLDDVALEALAEAYATPPPPALRDRLLAAASAGAAARRAATRWRTLGSLAAATTLVMGGLLASVLRHSGARESELAQLRAANADLQARLDAQAKSLAGLREALESQAQVLRVLAGPRTLVATLAPTAGQPASGRVVVDASTGEAALVVVGLDAPGEGKTYELWAIRGDRPPAPAGLFAGGRTAVAQMPRVPDPTSVTAFAVSIEPSGGSTSPTGPIVLAGPVRRALRGHRRPVHLHGQEHGRGAQGHAHPGVRRPRRGSRQVTRQARGSPAGEERAAERARGHEAADRGAVMARGLGGRRGPMSRQPSPQVAPARRAGKDGGAAQRTALGGNQR